MAQATSWLVARAHWVAALMTWRREAVSLSPGNFTKVTHPVLVVLIIALRGNVLGLQDQGCSAVGHSLGQPQHQVLPLPVAGVLLPDGVEDPVGGLAHLTGRTEQSLSRLKEKNLIKF